MNICFGLIDATKQECFVISAGKTRAGSKMQNREVGEKSYNEPKDSIGRNLYFLEKRELSA